MEEPDVIWGFSNSKALVPHTWSRFLAVSALLPLWNSEDGSALECQESWALEYSDGAIAGSVMLSQPRSSDIIVLQRVYLI